MVIRIKNYIILIDNNIYIYIIVQKIMEKNNKFY